MLAKTIPWRNSIALIIPSEKAKEMRLKPGEEVTITIEKRSNVLRELFGAIHFDKPIEQLLKEERKLVSKWE